MAGRSFGAKGPLEASLQLDSGDCKTFSPNRINKGRESSATGDPFPSLLPSLAALVSLSVSVFSPSRGSFPRRRAKGMKFRRVFILRPPPSLPPSLPPPHSFAYFPSILTHRQTRSLLILFPSVCRKLCRARQGTWLRQNHCQRLCPLFLHPRARRHVMYIL